MPPAPRKWNYSASPAISVLASIVIPSLPGVTRVLTDVRAYVLASTSSAGGNVFVEYNVSGGAIHNLILCHLPTGSGGDFGFSGEWSGEIIIPPNTVSAVQFQTAAVSWTEALFIQGYDILS